MGGKGSKEKKEDPAQLNLNTETLKHTQKSFTLAKCIGDKCDKFTDYIVNDKIEKNKHKYKFFIFLLILFIILIILYFSNIYKKK